MCDALTCRFDFALGSAVTILAIGIIGRVLQRSESSAGTEYQVLHWHDGERRTTWFHAGELRETERHAPEWHVGAPNG